MLGVEDDSFQRDSSPHTAPAIVGFAVGCGLGAGSEALFLPGMPSSPTPGSSTSISRYSMPTLAFAE